MVTWRNVALILGLLGFGASRVTGRRRSVAAARQGAGLNPLGPILFSKALATDESEQPMSRVARIGSARSRNDTMAAAKLSAVDKNSTRRSVRNEPKAQYIGLKHRTHTIYAMRQLLQYGTL